MNPKEDIKLGALSLGYNETTRAIDCPWCDSRGDLEKGSLAVTRLSEGLVYQCFRVKCKEHGFISSSISELYEKKPKEKKPQTFKRPLMHLPPKIIKWIGEEYNITPKDISRNHLRYDVEVNFLYMPIYNSTGYEIGACIKKLPEKFASGRTNMDYYHSQRKVVHYWFNPDEPKLHFPLCCVGYCEDLVIVEDILSAIRVQESTNGVRAVALLGTILSDDKVQVIKTMCSNICLALDADTWYIGNKHKEPLPFTLHRKYSLHFDSFKLARVTKDPKSLSDQEIHEQILEVIK